MDHGTDRSGLLRGQLALTRQLAEIVLADLTDEVCLRRPSPGSWTVHRDDRGRWVPDWDDDPPDDLAQPSLAWTMWQALWWGTVLLDQAEGRPVTPREEIVWPGATAGVDALRRLHDRWDAFLAARTEAELDAGDVVTFPFDDGRPLAAIAAWANVELTKNVAEMGVLRRLAEAA
ncbi:DinB family protein [Actinomycetospora rhizophila]|uniref:DinB family protein n=1 Tax=Actinomycetospora rhizophila TaxID=1416876 RepID=A0ABV9ZL29_9PSEU